MQNLLKPTNFREFIGQKQLVANLKIMIASAKERDSQLDHILLYGPPGLGKTSLASILAKEMSCRIRYAQGPMLEKKSDLLSLLASIEKGDIVFIDEIHGINKLIEEIIYPAIEEGHIDLIVGVDGDSKVVRIKLPAFTLVGATTKIGKVSAPLRDRFGIIVKMQSYNEQEIRRIIRNSARKLKVRISESAIILIAANSRLVPRVANNLLKRTLDYQIVNKTSEINDDIVLETFGKIGLYKYGLIEHHINYLHALETAFAQRHVSLDAISGFVGEEKSTIENEIEPVLITHEFIVKTSRGRQITEKGSEYLKGFKTNY